MCLCILLSRYRLMTFLQSSTVNRFCMRLSYCFLIDSLVKRFKDAEEDPNGFNTVLDEADLRFQKKGDNINDAERAEELVGANFVKEVVFDFSFMCVLIIEIAFSKRSKRSM